MVESVVVILPEIVIVVRRDENVLSRLNLPPTTTIKDLYSAVRGDASVSALFATLPADAVPLLTGPWGDVVVDQSPELALSALGLTVLGTGAPRVVFPSTVRVLLTAVPRSALPHVYPSTAAAPAGLNATTGAITLSGP